MPMVIGGESRRNHINRGFLNVDCSEQEKSEFIEVECSQFSMLYTTMLYLECSKTTYSSKQ